MVNCYIKYLLDGDTRISAFCKCVDCTECVQTTKLYVRVCTFHEQDSTQSALITAQIALNTTQSILTKKYKGIQ